MQELETLEAEESTVSPSRPPAAGEWDLLLSMQESIERLPEKLRSAVILYYLMDCPVEEIARSLKMHPNTIYSRLNKALDRLKGEFRDLEVRW